MKDGNTARPQGNLNRIDCPSGDEQGLVEGFAEPLSRAYPRAVPGLTEVTANGFRGVGTGRVEAWYPGAERPQVNTVNVTDVDLTAVDGGWRLTGRVAGEYSVTNA